MAASLAILLALGFAIIVIGAWGNSSVAEQRRFSALHVIADKISGRVERNAAIGMWHGVAVTDRFESRRRRLEQRVMDRDRGRDPRGVSAGGARAAAAPLRSGADRPQRADRCPDPRSGVRSAVLIEAAPADVVRLLLDPESRGLLASHTAIELDTEGVGPRRVLRLAIRRWLEDVSEAEPAIETCARLASRVRDAFAAVEAQTLAREQGSPYRPMLDDQPAREAADARAREIAHVEATRALRAAQQASLHRVLAVLIFGILFLCFAAGISGALHD